MNKMKHQVVCIREGAIAELERILNYSPQNRLFFVVDDSAYAASGANAVLEPRFHHHSIARFSGFELNPKLHDVERGVELYRSANPDMIIALGGGTAIDLSKSIRAVASQDASAHAVVTGKAPIRESGPPLIAIPTTAGTGSEATHFAVVYIKNEKFSLAHPSLLPDYALVDPMLTHSLPSEMTAATGLDAFCQAIESIWAIGATDQSLGYAQQAVRLASEHLVSATCNPTRAARRGMAEASHLAGKAIDISKTTASHALSYPITSRYGIPHGMAVALSLSPMLAFNAEVTASDCSDPRGPEEVLKRI